MADVQIGDGNVQHITCVDVLEKVVALIGQQKDIPEETKRDWAETLRKILMHPLTQTTITTAAGAAPSVARSRTGRGRSRCQRRCSWP